METLFVEHRWIDGVEMKRCGKCERWLPLELFGRRTRGPDGHEKWCRECRNRLQRERYAVKGKQSISNRASITSPAPKHDYGPKDYCAACGIIRELLPSAPDDPPDNGVCCSACLAEYPELAGMSRDEVMIWLWQQYGSVWEIDGTYMQQAGAIARTWLRVQFKRGRVDETMADVAAGAFGLSDTSRYSLRRYVRELAARDAGAELA